MSSIRPLQGSDLAKLIKLSDECIGKDYYSLKELEGVYKRSVYKGVQCSFVLEEDEQLVGFRFTFPPGLWEEGKGKGLTEDLWPHEKKWTAYFQSLFLSPAYTGQGWGKKLSLCSINQLKSLGAKGIVCHSWVESPGDSSRKYLKAMGFKTIATHREYWKDIDYDCLCGGKPCLCTAEEMYLDLE